MPRDSAVNWRQAALHTPLTKIEPPSAAKAEKGPAGMSQVSPSSASAPRASCSGGCHDAPRPPESWDPLANVASASARSEGRVSQGNDQLERPGPSRRRAAAKGLREAIEGDSNDEPSRKAPGAAKGSDFPWGATPDQRVRETSREAGPSHQGLASWSSSGPTLDEEDLWRGRGGAGKGLGFPWGDLDPRAPEFPYESIGWLETCLPQLQAEVDAAGGVAFRPTFDKRNSDYAPGAWWGLDPADVERAEGDSPYNDRILIAISKDARSWTRTGLVISERSSVPCLAVEEDPQTGREVLYLFFNAVNADTGDIDVESPVVGEPPGPLIVASTEDLVTWQYNYVSIFKDDDDEEPIELGDINVVIPDDWEFTIREPQDPSVVRDVRTSKDRWLLYFTLYLRERTEPGEEPDPHAIAIGCTFVASAPSLSSNTWTLENDGEPIFPLKSSIEDAFEEDDLEGIGTAKDPNVTWVGQRPISGYQYFSASNGTSYNSFVLWAGNSTRILPITDIEWEEETTEDGKRVHIFPTNGFRSGRDIRMLACGESGRTEATGKGYLYSYTWVMSDDPTTYGGTSGEWVRDSDEPILGDPNEVYEFQRTWDAAAVYFKGCYVMAYVTRYKE